jgi:hypothetical protein
MNQQNSDNVLLKCPQIPGQTIEAYLPISEFECSNSVMYNDFQELLKAYEYPLSQMFNPLPVQLIITKILT